MATCLLQSGLRRNVKLRRMILPGHWLCSSSTSLSAFPTKSSHLTVLHHVQQTKVESDRIVTHLI
jgi:hypothetical protein